MSESIKVTSHVARDLLQSADLFRHPERVVWEYVANGLEYVEPGVQPHVRVILRGKERITVSDNGRGMDRAGLERFFTMHAENQDRLSGRPGRGMFGTGKAAAFAIANLMRITTVKDRKRSAVELRRSDLEAASSGDAVPVRTLEMEIATGEPNGTRVEIEQFRIKRLTPGDIVKGVERHLRHWRGVRVEIDGTLVEPHIPATAFTECHIVLPEDAPQLAGCKLVLHVAKAPLGEEDRGVAILANGTLHETTLGSAKGKPMAQYVFGEIDVPALSQPFDGIAAFDMSRSGQLNPENAVVVQAYAVISRHAEKLRQRLVEQERSRKNAEQAARLQNQADAIARLINEDFSEYARRFAPVRSGGGRAADLRPTTRPSSAGETHFLHGGEEPARIVPGDTFQRGDQDRPIGPEPRPAQPQVEPAKGDVADSVGRTQIRAPAKRHPSGGFSVEFRENGSEAHRAFYERESRTIFVNLDHPQVMAARGQGEIEEPNFRRLSFEIAFTEYAIGFAQEKASNGEYTEFYDPLFDMRERIDALARKASGVFAARD